MGQFPIAQSCFAELTKTANVKSAVFTSSRAKIMACERVGLYRDLIWSKVDRLDHKGNLAARALVTP